MAIFLAGKAVCYRILAFFCYGKLHFKCESADPCTKSPKYTSDTRQTDGKIMPIKAVFEKEGGILKQVV